MVRRQERRVEWQKVRLQRGLVGRVSAAMRRTKRLLKDSEQRVSVDRPWP